MRKKFFMEPGKKVRLKHFDPDCHGKKESEKSALEKMESLGDKLFRLQNALYAEKKHALLIVLQGAPRRRKSSGEPVDLAQMAE